MDAIKLGGNLCPVLEQDDRSGETLGVMLDSVRDSMQAFLCIVYSAELSPEGTKLNSDVQKIHIKKVLIQPR